MKKLLSVVLLTSSMGSYAGYIIPDTRDNEIHFNDTTSASSFRKIKFGALSRGVYNSTTEKNDGSDDEDQTITDDSLIGRTHMDKITLEGLITKYSYDEEEDYVGNSLFVYHLGAAFMPNEKLAIGASVQIWDVEDGLLDQSIIALDSVFKIQENMYLGAGVTKLTYAYDTELDDKKTLHGGFGMLTKDFDFEGVLTVAPGDSNKTKGVYRDSEASLIFSGVYRINEKLEFYGKYTTKAEASDYSDLNVDTEESTSVVELELEYEISEHLFVAGSIEGTSSEYTDNDTSDNNFETTGNSKALRFRYLKDQFEGQFAYTVDSSEKDAKDNDEDEDESSNSYSFLLAYKF